MNTFKAPYLSYIIASRNDDYGIALLRSLQVSINGFIEQCDKYRLDAELIFVEWNSVDDNARISARIRWPRSSYCSVRVIDVPHALHERFAHSGRYNFHAACAVNCGIRRSRGAFVLPGTCDHLFSAPLIEYIAERKLKDDCIYRIDVSEVDRGVLEKETLLDQLAFCSSHVVKVFNGSEPVMNGWPALHRGMPGDFQLMSRSCWFKLHGYREEDITSWYVDNFLSSCAYAADIQEIVLEPPMYLYHIRHELRIQRQGWRVRTTLLERFVKSRFVHPKLRERIFNIGLYWCFADGRKLVWVSGVPLRNAFFWAHRLERGIIEKKRSFVINDDSWGLSDAELSEKYLRRADWEQ
ncbi:MAG: hypothetical protein ABIJ27_01655 [Candidatus Omnitrophota bacterium]